MRKRAIQKLIIKYDDGFTEEIDAVQTILEEIKNSKPGRCLVCHDPKGHGNLPCPIFNNFSEYYDD
jgi:hypothetical protein